MVAPGPAGVSPQAESALYVCYNIPVGSCCKFQSYELCECGSLALRSLRMQGKRISLRLGLWALVAALVLGSLGSLSLARDAFDSGFNDCPQKTRLSAVDGLAVERTDEEDEIRISWDALDLTDLDVLGSNYLKARLTVIVEGGGDEDARNVALGDTDLVVGDVEFTKNLAVSVAITLGDYVLSDIAKADFTSGMPAPSFMTDIIARVVDEDDADGDGNTTEFIFDGEDYGDFYYLGFNDLFDNWYPARAEGTRTLAELNDRPASPRFRVGLRHGDEDLDPDDADFDHYRITIEDSNGDFLGYQAKTVASRSSYSFVRDGTRHDRVIHFGETGENILVSGRGRCKLLIIPLFQ